VTSPVTIWRHANPEKDQAIRERETVRRHATLDAERSGVTGCECCGRDTPGPKRWHRDHDHETGEFRGWLCHWCNTGIGSLGDNLHGLYQAVRYLEDRA
jgi:hypothetical protein